MKKRIYAKLNNGMDLTVRVLTTLRRKEFDIFEIDMKRSGDAEVDLFITLDALSNLHAESALNQVEKIYGVSEVKLV